MRRWPSSPSRRPSGTTNRRAPCSKRNRLSRVGFLDSEVERLYVSLGRAYGFQNAWPRTQQTYEELLAYAQEHQLPALASMTLNRLAILAVQQGKDKPQVQALLEQAWQHGPEQFRSTHAGRNGVEPGPDHRLRVG